MLLLMFEPERIVDSGGSMSMSAYGRFARQRALAAASILSGVREFPQGNGADVGRGLSQNCTASQAGGWH